MKTIIITIIALVVVPTMTFAQTGEEFAELLGMHLGKDVRLTDVKKRLGETRLTETGEAGEYKATICYYVPKCQTKVEFWSDELGGPEHDLIGFTLTRSIKPPIMCLALPLEDCAKLSVSSKIRLGMPLDEYKKTVGNDAVLEGKYYQKSFDRREPMTENERSKMMTSYPDIPEDLYWDIIIFLRAAFDTDGLATIEVSKTETN